MVEESGQSAELNSDHGNIDPSFGAGDRGFIVTDQAAMVHQPAERALDDPAMWQHFESAHIIRTLDHFDRQLGAEGLDRRRKFFSVKSFIMAN